MTTTYIVHLAYGYQQMASDQADVLLLSSLFQQDFLNRPFVPQMSPLPWFYVELETIFRRPKEKIMLMIGTYDLLKDVLSTDGTKYRVLSILYVTPGLMNRSAHWRMDQVLEVVEKDEANHSVPYFRVTGGRCYSGFSSCDDADLRGGKVIFRPIKRRSKGTPT